MQWVNYTDQEMSKHIRGEIGMKLVQYNEYLSAMFTDGLVL